MSVSRSTQQGVAETAKHEDTIVLLKQAERKLVQALADAEAASRGKTQLLADISHDMRTPLNAVIGYAKLLLNEKLDRKSNAQVQHIHEAGLYLVGLVNDILANCDTCDPIELDVELADTDVPALIDSCVPLVMNQAEAAGVNLKIDIARDFPVIRTDSKRLKQVILNLIENAIKFTRPGGRVTVKAWAEKNGDAYVLVVSDTGIGIAPENGDRAPISDEQGASHDNGPSAGKGLGLPITRRIVESLGGTLDIRSHPGEGTVVILRFPNNPPRDHGRAGT